VVLYGMPWETYQGIMAALGEYHTRHTYDHGTLELRSPLYGVSWESYMAFVEATADYRLRHTYDQGTLEMRSPRKSHEWDTSLLGRLLEMMVLELDTPIQSVGSTTFFRALGTRGLQPDRSYYVANEPRVRGKGNGTRRPTRLRIWSLKLTGRAVLCRECRCMPRCACPSCGATAARP
jgi:Uma2 family endonuclease